MWIEVMNESLAWMVRNAPSEPLSPTTTQRETHRGPFRWR
jgi:hypothetical protein